MAKVATAAGFTLIELAIALVIVGITASFAMSSYRRHLVRTYRTEAIQSLLAIAAEQEKFHLNHRRYSDRLDAAPGDELPGLPVGSTTLRGRYRLTIEHADAARFLVVASPQAERGQDDPQCRRITIDESGRRRAEDAARRDSTARCW